MGLIRHSTEHSRKQKHTKKIEKIEKTKKVKKRAVEEGGASRERIVALAGNPNVGKSTLFNALTGMRQHTGNWTGKTVGIAEGRCRYAASGNLRLVDLPGTYSLDAHSEEERVAKEFIESGIPDAVAVVCDATCLERNLILVLQILALSDCTVVFVNLLDEAKKKGIVIDLALLSQRLGVPVVGMSARSGKGIDEAIALLEGCEKNERPLRGGSDPEQTVRQAEQIAGEVTRRGESRKDERDRKIDRILTSRRWGFPLMLLMLALIFWLTIEGANLPSALLSRGLFWVGDRLLLLFEAWGAPPWLSGALIMGVYRTVAWVVSVMLPPMAIFFPLFTILEDLGVLPRIAFNLDRCFQACDACGKQALTM